MNSSLPFKRDERWVSKGLSRRLKPRQALQNLAFARFARQPTDDHQHLDLTRNLAKARFCNACRGFNRRDFRAFRDIGATLTGLVGMAVHPSPGSRHGG